MLIILKTFINVTLILVCVLVFIDVMSTNNTDSELYNLINKFALWSALLTLMSALVIALTQYIF